MLRGNNQWQAIIKLQWKAITADSLIKLFDLSFNSGLSFIDRIQIM